MLIYKKSSFFVRELSRQMSEYQKLMCIINDFVLNNCTACDILQKNKKRKKHGAFDFALTADSDIANKWKQYAYNE